MCLLCLSPLLLSCLILKLAGSPSLVGAGPRPEGFALPVWLAGISTALLPAKFSCTASQLACVLLQMNTQGAMRWLAKGRL